MSEAIFSKVLPAGAKTYFFDVRQTQNGKGKYVQVTETRMREGQRVRSSITIFPDQLTAFTAALEEAKASAE
jgi:hypothetical protein